MKQMYSIPMINTYNESSLHRTLKNILCKEYNGKTEIEIDNYICDIVSKNNEIIEVQTKNLGNLTGKILNLLENHKVTLVYPLPCTSYIEYYKHINEKPISRKKSPRKKNIYDIFDELMGCFPVLLHENFTLKIIETSITKERIKTDTKVQSQNKKRRFLKNWLTHDTTLDELHNTFVLKTRQDYVQLLPDNLQSQFTVKDVVECNNVPVIKKDQAYKMLWTFRKMGIIEFLGKEGRSKMYRIVNN